LPGMQQAQNGDSRASRDSRQYATFFIAGLYCGVDVLRVQEVLLPQRMSRVPLAPPLIEGLINLRGQIVTALDMRRRLQLPERAAPQAAMNMVVRGEGRAVSLLVDEIGDVIQVSGESFEMPPRNLPPEQRRVITGIHKLEGRLLLVLDIDRVLQFDDAGMAGSSTDANECSINTNGNGETRL
jgi:purine-binding chemotaxis protein CheW